MKKKKKKNSQKRIFIKLFLCLVYLIAMTVLSVCAYRIFQEKEAIKKQIESDEQAEEDAKKAILEAEKAAEAKKQEAERNAKIAQLKADYQAAVARGEFTGTLVDYLERK